MLNGVTYGGSFNNAVNTSYDNTDSQLEATNVQDAIDENAEDIATLNSSISDLTAYVELSANGIETYSQFLNRLYATIDKSKVTPRAAIYITGLQICLPISVISSAQIQLASGGVGSGQVMATTVALASSGSFIGSIYNGQYSDYSSNVATGRVEFHY